MLKNVSASTIDRLLKAERNKFILKGKSTTKPGVLLKKNIDIRTSADWNEKNQNLLKLI